MDITVIQERLNHLSGMMLAKSLRQPRAEFQMKAHEGPVVMLVWSPLKQSRYDSGIYKWFKEGSIGEMLDAAEQHILSLPSADETKFREFMAALGGVIDLGRENGIEVEFLNPLVATAKALSKNALVHRPRAA